MWNDDDRERAIALDEYERSLCPCGCGMTRAEGHDPNRGFDIDWSTCYAGKAIAYARRQLRSQAEDSKGDVKEGWDDGLLFFVADSRIENETQSTR